MGLLWAIVRGPCYSAKEAGDAGDDIIESSGTNTVRRWKASGASTAFRQQVCCPVGRKVRACQGHAVATQRGADTALGNVRGHPSNQGSTIVRIKVLERFAPDTGKGAMRRSCGLDAASDRIDAAEAVGEKMRARIRERCSRAQRPRLRTRDASDPVGGGAVSRSDALAAVVNDDKRPAYRATVNDVVVHHGSIGIEAPANGKFLRTQPPYE
jgi:hypothetical protein